MLHIVKSSQLLIDVISILLFHIVFSLKFILYTALFIISGRDETLYAYALIARAAVETTVPFLTRLFSERFALLSQVLDLSLIFIVFSFFP